MMRGLPMLLIVAACAEPVPSRGAVTGPRILAIRAGSPEIRPDETTTLETLFADPFGDCDFVTTWSACIDPPAGDPLRCVGHEGSWSPEPGLSTALAIPEALRPTGTATIGIVLDLCCLEPGPSPRVCGDRKFPAVRRVEVSSDPENENPQIAALSFGGVEIPPDYEGIAIQACPEGCPPYRVSVRPTDESTETIEDPPGTFRSEGLFAAFAADGGSFTRPFDDGATLTSDFELEPGDAGESFRIWVVLHDDRGGVDFREFRVELQ